MVGSSTVARGIFTVILAGLLTWWIGSGVKATYESLAGKVVELGRP